MIKNKTMRLAAIAMWSTLSPFSSLTAGHVDEGVLRSLEIATFVSSTDSSNRTMQVQELIEILNREKAKGRSAELRLVEGIAMALSEIDTTGESKAALKAILAAPETADCSPAARALAQVIRVSAGCEALVEEMKPFLLARNAEVVHAAADAIGKCNTPQSISIINGFVDASLTQLPAASFTITDETRTDLDLRWNRVLLGLAALKKMDAPAAIEKISQTIKSLREVYIQGDGRVAVEEMESQLAKLNQQAGRR